jgi:hypothetical protein
LSITSPRIARFAAASVDDASAATDALRRDLESAAGPFVEPIEGSDDVLVTFVYVADAESLELATHLVVWEATKQTVPMERVPGTDVWQHSIVADPRVATTYQFIRRSSTAASRNWRSCSRIPSGSRAAHGRSSRPAGPIRSTRGAAIRSPG